MNTLKLLKLAPTLIMVAVMAYAAYSINPQVPSRLEYRNGQSRAGRLERRPA